ncbi:MAG: hypothetical protein JWN46_1325 [Acidimicrobiales bacterium]|nr:hypothetical protein [Acidimicrobiales bacterium]
MDYNHDEVRRQLREVEAEQKVAMRSWRESLMRVFAGHESASDAAKAQLVGAPDRRSFLKIGGVTVAGAAVLAACGKDTKKSASTTTGAAATTAAPTTGMADSSTTAPSTDSATDMTLLRTATSLELLAVAVYKTAIPLLKDKTSAQVATLFMNQHDEHAKQLQGATKEAFGASKVEMMPNDYLNKNVVQPALPTLKNDGDIAKFALTLENTAAATYCTAAGLLSTPALRAAIMAIGGVEARHAAILSGVLQQSVPTVAFFDLKPTIPKASFVA